MISGVIAQGPTVPRGMVAPATYFDDGETVVTPFIDLAATITRLLIPGVTSDSDTIFAARRLLSLTAAFVADVDNVRAPRLVAAQVLRPVLYVAIDVFSLPAIALPGILQTHFHAADDGFFSPFIAAHGSLRPGLFNAFDAIYAPTIVRAQTLLPNLYSASDSIYAPAARLNWIFARFLSDSDVFYAPTRSGGAALATFNGTADQATLSNGNRTATHTSTNTGGARSTAYKSTGKYYFEVTVTTTHGGWDTVGIAIATASYGNIVDDSINGVIVQMGGGSIYTIAGFGGGKSLGPCVSGDVISVAADLGGQKVWFCRNGGNWNGLVITSENPVTGLGGVAIGDPSAALAPAVGFGGPDTAINDAMTANFGSSAYAYARPTGFVDWEA